MLKVRDLVKIYVTKGAKPVRAVDGVSIRFEETGMVFLLGKSGSGKSTLLNLCGGLDTPDEGEIIIKGRSSKDFTQSDFDSYRNTYVGFVFQEYNILEEFSVEDNIALALELQGRKNHDEVEKILREVDLAEFAKRKPNTLSGGQRQRVAIARALVKNPEIIMADEPTGALDSQTGKQVFDTLKRLSAHKLVIVVSHDRDFAEEYADRIIELKDGKIISDVSKTTSEATGSGNVRFVGENTISIRQGSLLTQEDLARINRFLADSPQDIIITNGAQEVDSFRKAAHIDEQGASSTFEHTDETRIAAKTYSQEEQAFIRSRLPLRQAIRIGASSMKIKPVRLFFTIFLCFIAFTMFGLFSTLTFFSRAQTSMRTYRDLGYETLTLQNNYVSSVTTYQDGVESDSWTNNTRTNFTHTDIDALRERYGNGVAGIFTYDTLSDMGVLSEPRNTGRSYSTGEYYNINVTGFAETDPTSAFWQERLLTDTDLSALGPDDVVISSYYFDSLRDHKLFTDTTCTQQVPLEQYQDAVGQKIILRPNNEYIQLTIRGVYRYDLPEQFLPLRDAESLTPSLEELKSALNREKDSGMYNVFLVNGNFYETHYEQFGKSAGGIGESHYDFLRLQVSGSVYGKAENGYVYLSGMSNFNSIPSMQGSIPAGMTRFDGKPADTPLADGEAIISFDLLFGQLFSMAKSIYESMNASAPQAAAAWVQTAQQYATLLSEGTPFGSDNQAVSDAISFVNALIEQTKDDPALCFDPSYTLQINESSQSGNDSPVNMTISAVGFYYGALNANYDAMFLSVNDLQFVNRISAQKDSGSFNSFTSSDYAFPDGAFFQRVVVPVPQKNADLLALLEGENVVSDDATFYVVSSAISYQIDAVEYVMSMLELIFLIVGVVMALLAMLLLFNFISVSISNKKKEIGILRAVGARGADVFKIFFSEAAIIGLVCYVLSVIACFILCGVMNNIVATMLPVTLFIFGPLSWLVMLAIAVLTCLLATFLPVRSAAKRRPVESIRAL